MSRLLLWAALYLGVAACAPASLPTRPDVQGPPERLIARDDLFATRIAKPRLSPDGRRLAYLAPFEGVFHIWVRTVGGRDDRVVTRDQTHDVRFLRWQCDSRHLLYLQDRAGDERWHLYRVDIETAAVRDLTPVEGVRAWPIADGCDDPDHGVLELDLKRRGRTDAYRINFRTGDLSLVVENPGTVVEWTADRQLRVRAARAVTPAGDTVIRVRDEETSPWRVLQRWSTEESEGRVRGFGADGRSLYLISSVGAPAARLSRVDLATGRETVVAEDPKRDVIEVRVHPRTGDPQAVVFDRWTTIDPSVRGDLTRLRAIDPSGFDIVSGDLEDRTWIVHRASDGKPGRYDLYDRVTGDLTLLFHEAPLLEDARLARMHPVSFRARDGLTLHGYLTLPAGAAPRRLPMVVLVHGGPWGRQALRFDPEVQWLANRGYAVLQVNFRGSTGYGKAYLNAGNREWGGKMLTDVLDGKAWAVREGYADPTKVCIMGASYGGYAALAALAFTPTEFACGIASAAPSDLAALARSRGRSFRPLFNRRVGAVETEEAFLRSQSPLFAASRIVAPLLIAHGANDVNVHRLHGDQLVAALRTQGQSVEYLLFPDEGHTLARLANRLRFYAAAEHFLARHLGGRHEPASAAEDWTPLRR